MKIVSFLIRILLPLLFFCPASFSSDNSGLNIGDKIPVFNLESQEGKLISFDTNFKGKVLLLVVANYCTKDLAGVWTTPSFYRFHYYKDFAYPFIFSRECVPFYVPNLFVSQAADNTAKTIKIPYFLMDWEKATFNKLNGSSDYSHVYVVDRKGIVRWKKILTTPFFSPEPMNEFIKNLLNEKN